MPGPASNHAATAPPWRAVAVLAVTFAAALFAADDPPVSTATGPADPDLIAQKAVCFPPPKPESLKTFAAEGVVLWTDAPIDGGALLDNLAAVRRHLRAILPPPPDASQPAHTPERPVAVAAYRKPTDYLAVWRRIGIWYGGGFDTITTQGYSYRVFCATAFGSPEEFAHRRPVVCHEFAHVWLYQSRGLANDGNWLTEGVANAVQLRFFPNSGSRADFLLWMERGRMLPLKRLMDLDRIAPKDYWQAATLVETILSHYPGRLPDVLAAFNEGRSAQAIVTETLKSDFPTLEAQWAAHVRASAQQAHTRPSPR